MDRPSVATQVTPRSLISSIVSGVGAGQPAARAVVSTSAP
jgi:hypothetical protein